MYLRFNLAPPHFALLPERAATPTQALLDFETLMAPRPPTRYLNSPSAFSQLASLLGSDTAYRGGPYFAVAAEISELPRRAFESGGRFLGTSIGRCLRHRDVVTPSSAALCSVTS